MGSNRVTIGNRGAIPLYSFTPSGSATDTGSLAYDKSLHYSQVRGCTDFTLALTGTGTNYSIKLYFTTDVATAEGTANNWYQVAAPSTEANAQWSNPLQNVDGMNVCHFKAHAIAFRAVATDTLDGARAGNVSLTLMGSF